MQDNRVYGMNNKMVCIDAMINFSYWTLPTHMSWKAPPPAWSIRQRKGCHVSRVNMAIEGDTTLGCRRRAGR